MHITKDIENNFDPTIPEFEILLDNFTPFHEIPMYKKLVSIYIGLNK